MGFWVYILRCSDGSYDTGHTEDLEKRLTDHNTGAAKGYTDDKRPVALLYAEEFPERVVALSHERQIKGWSRKKKEAFMRGDWAELSRLSRPHHLKSVRPEPVEGHTSKV
ncbi:MAG: GIY-YIG nuclease family protein [Elusimicrobiota bacterium]